MLWLIAIVLGLQVVGFWVLNPLTQVATGVLSLNGLPWLLAILGLWLLTGRSNNT